MSESRAIAVLGGGITGLTAAHRLVQLGHRVRLFEQNVQLGGAIRTELSDGWLIEAGPNSLQASPEINALIRELGLAGEVVEANPTAQNRYIARAGRLVPMPHSPGAFLASSFFSTRTKFRVLAEMTTRPRQRSADCSIAEFARTHFGEELLDYAIQPFVSGIHAGDAESLSTRHAFPKLWAMEQRHGSVVLGQMAAAKARRAVGESAIPAIISFRRGLQTLPDALGARLPADTVTLNARVKLLLPGNPWQVVWQNGQGEHTEKFDAVIAALPAASLARLGIGGAGEKPLATLDTIPHPPLSALFLGLRQENVAHPLDGFGALVPAREKRAVLGIIFSSTLFPDRAPAGHVALTVMVGGALRPELASAPTAELLASVRGDLRELLGVNSEPVFLRHTFWPRAIPQYDLGYEQHLETIATCEQAHPGLFIGGQVRDGISLPNCISAGEKLAIRAGAGV